MCVSAWCGLNPGEESADQQGGETAVVATLTKGQPPVELMRVYAVLGAVLSGAEMCLLVCTKARRIALPDGCAAHVVRKV